MCACEREAEQSTGGVLGSDTRMYWSPRHKLLDAVLATLNMAKSKPTMHAVVRGEAQIPLEVVFKVR